MTRRRLGTAFVLLLAAGAALAPRSHAHNGETPLAGNSGSVPQPLAPPFVPPTLLPPTTAPRDGRTGSVTGPAWTRWWAANADGIVPPRGRREAVATRDEVGAPGSPAPLRPGRTLASTVRPEILPTLRWAADAQQAFPAPVVCAAYLALGKAASRLEDVGPLLEAVRQPHAPPEEAEACLLALGLLRRTAPSARLDAATLDLARTACLGAIEDDRRMPRARALAAISLGLLADQPTAEPEPAPGVGSAVGRALWARAQQPFAGDEIPSGVLLGLSLQPRSAVPRGTVEGLRRIVTTGRLGRCTHGPTARSFASLALARLDEGGALGVHLGMLLGRRHSVPERRAAAAALGVAAASFDAAQRAEAALRLVEALREAPSGLDLAPACLVAIARLVAADLDAGSDALVRDAPGGHPGRVPAALVGALSIPSVEVRPHAVLALSYAALRTEPALALPEFRAFRARAIEALRRLVREGEGSPDSRGAWLVGLGLLEDVEAIPSLRAAVERTSGSDAPRAFACEALGLIGRAVPDAVEPLRAVLAERSASAGLLDRAARALGRLGGADGAHLLALQLAAGGSDSRLSPVVLALGWTAHPDAVQPLVRLVRDPRTSDTLRAIACQSLGMLADPGPVPALTILAPGAADLPWTEATGVCFSLL